MHASSRQRWWWYRCLCVNDPPNLWLHQRLLVYSPAVLSFTQTHRFDCMHGFVLGFVIILCWRLLQETVAFRPSRKIVLSVSETTMTGKNKQACIVLKNEFFVQRSSSHHQRS